MLCNLASFDHLQDHFLPVDRLGIGQAILTARDAWGKQQKTSKPTIIVCQVRARVNYAAGHSIVGIYERLNAALQF
jgi:hypothetical protein